MKIPAIFGQGLLACVLVMVAACTPVAHEQLAGSEWRPTQIGSMVVSPASNLSIQFKNEGKFTGHGGCNGFFGQYTVMQDKIEFGPVGATRMFCAEPGMDLESAFFAALSAARTYHMDDAHLTLFDETGKEHARLIRVPAERKSQ